MGSDNPRSVRPTESWDIIDGREKAHFDLTTATLGTGHKGPATTAP